MNAEVAALLAKAARSRRRLPSMFSIADFRSPDTMAGRPQHAPSSLEVGRAVEGAEGDEQACLGIGDGRADLVLKPLDRAGLRRSVMPLRFA